MKVFCDFDGTVAKNDVGNLLFRTFADGRCFDIVNLWKKGVISSKECLTEECRIARVTREELEHFADAQQVDPYFKEFVVYCQKNRIQVEILSDGLDFYIERILKNHGLVPMVNFRSNHLVFVNRNQIRPEFPYYEKGCGKCGNCKGYHIREARTQGKHVIYVGDGLSDRCGAKEADLVFAKRDLLKFCQQNQIPHFEFKDFGEVFNQLKKIL
ncbi:MAG: MtnX-like HAD-IB family phosphatase [bacterium]